MLKLAKAFDRHPSAVSTAQPSHPIQELINGCNLLISISPLSKIEKLFDERKKIETATKLLSSDYKNHPETVLDDAILHSYKCVIWQERIKQYQKPSSKGGGGGGGGGNGNKANSGASSGNNDDGDKGNGDGKDDDKSSSPNTDDDWLSINFATIASELENKRQPALVEEILPDFSEDVRRFNSDAAKMFHIKNPKIFEIMIWKFLSVNMHGTFHDFGKWLNATYGGKEITISSLCEKQFKKLQNDILVTLEIN